jgi:hypothetical protein
VRERPPEGGRFLLGFFAPSGFFAPRLLAMPLTVIPAKAGIHFAFGRRSKWIPAFAGMTGWRPFAGIMDWTPFVGIMGWTPFVGMTGQGLRRR